MAGSDLLRFIFTAAGVVLRTEVATYLPTFALVYIFRQEISWRSR